MATMKKKTAPRKSGKPLEAKTGAGAAMAERSKDAKKPSFGTAAPKSVKAPVKTPAKAMPAAKPSTAAKKSASDKPSMASRVIRKVKDTASGAVAMAASAIGRDGKEPPKAKSK